MKKNGFKKTAAGIMSVAMMLSAVVLPGTIKNAPAISNVLTASASPNTATEYATASSQDVALSQIATVADADQSNSADWVSVATYTGDVTKTVFEFDLTGTVTSVLANNIRSYNLAKPYYFDLTKDADDLSTVNGPVTLSDGALGNLEIEEIIIGKGTWISGAAFGGSKIHNIVVDYAQNLAINENSFKGADFSELDSFTFNGTAEEYEAFRNSNSSFLESVAASGATMAVPTAASQGDDVVDQGLPEGVTIESGLTLGSEIGGSFKITSTSDKYVRFTFSTDDAMVSSEYPNYNYVTYVAPNSTDTVTFQVSPKNMASKIRYTVELSDLPQVITDYTMYVSKDFSVANYLTRVINEGSDEVFGKYKQLARATLLYGNAAQKYFAEHGAFGKDGKRLTGLPFESADIPEYTRSTAPNGTDFDKWCSDILFTAEDKAKISDYKSYSLMLESMTRFKVQNASKEVIFESPNIMSALLWKVYNGTTTTGKDPVRYSAMMWVNTALEKFAESTTTYQIAYALKQFAWEAALFNGSGV